jgi:hypothetical protein
MQDANIHLMFWGAAWLSAANQPTAAAVVTALTSLVSGPYLGKLAQYGVKHAQIADVNVVDFGGQTAAPLTIKTASGGNKTFNIHRTTTLDNNATSRQPTTRANGRCGSQ